MPERLKLTTNLQGLVKTEQQKQPALINQISIHSNVSKSEWNYFNASSLNVISTIILEPFRKKSKLP